MPICNPFIIFLVFYRLLVKSAEQNFSRLKVKADGFYTVGFLTDRFI